MSDLSPADVRSLAKAADISVPEALLSEVTHSLNALRERIAAIDVPGLDQVEAGPVVMPWDPP